MLEAPSAVIARCLAAVGWAIHYEMLPERVATFFYEDVLPVLRIQIPVITNLLSYCRLYIVESKYSFSAECQLVTIGRRA